MTGLQKDILEIILKSQLNIKEAVMARLVEMRERYATNNVADLISVTQAELDEIKRQLKHIWENQNAN